MFPPSIMIFSPMRLWSTSMVFPDDLNGLP
jgi:hypothetical protein